MIFVTVGTNEAPFDRLLTAVEALVGVDEVVVQHGSSRILPPGARCVDFLSYEDTVDMIRRADVVVTHAGVGTLMTALANGKRPFVVPRRKQHGEAVDDHQVEFARAIEDAELAVVVHDPADLAAIVSVDAGRQAIELGPARSLVDDLRGYVESRAGASRRRT